jgi:lysozyme family protein
LDNSTKDESDCQDFPSSHHHLLHCCLLLGAMMDLLDAALEYTLREEGGWSNVKGDKGGATNWGITIGVFLSCGKDSDVLGFPADLDGDDDVDADDLKLLTKEQAKEIYRLKYDQMDKLGECDPRIKIKHFDIGVNCGTHTANKILQRAINRVFGPYLDVDGQIGMKSVRGISGCNPDALLTGLCAEQLAHYEAIVEHDPTQAKFLGTEDKPKGWRNRAARKPEVTGGLDS